MDIKEPLFDKTSLFEARQGGYATYRIPGIVVTARGTVLAYCEGRKHDKDDWGAIDILMRRSTDGGCTWGERQRISRLGHRVAKNPVARQQKPALSPWSSGPRTEGLVEGLASSDGQTFNNPVAIADRRTGAVHFLYCAEYARCYYVRSDNDGQRLSHAVDITSTFEQFRPEYEWRVIATGPGHGIQLRSGRLLVPIWMSTGAGEGAHRPSVVSVIYSDDGGQTWQRGEIVVRHSDTVPNPSEGVATQLRDGRVMLNIRNESGRHRRLVSLSADGVRGWSEATFAEDLFEPVCFASLLCLSGHREHKAEPILFVNPDSRDNPQGPNYWLPWPSACPEPLVLRPKDGGLSLRRNLTVRLSCDRGRTWPVSKVLDPGISGYADLAAGPDGTIYCFYESGGIGGDAFDTACLMLARFNLAWLTEGTCTPM
ncbi:MAG: exo-alpha-sialidase [Anaerolineae bacterium]|nr:MAG: exo-alpha-sialidase [Anaerolineae bacterium]